MRIDVDPAVVPPFDFYRLLTETVVPRPIAWVSTVTPEGIPNLAPHSFFTISSVAPPVVHFTSVGRRDSLRNVEATGQFVVNLAPEPLMHQVNVTATTFPSGVSEFEQAALATEASLRVKPPQVALSPVALECELHSTLGIGDSTVVFGRVVHALVSDEVMVDGHPEIRRLLPLARLGRDEWGTVASVHELGRVPYAGPEGGA
ncbi:flavin reductase family protein [Streptomyces hundungensis]|uniref:flavin reductase family protein n=1 Tax=Streptomyces hundungensis TaxID=1077946 RepID=UPI0033FDEDC2